MTRPVEPVLSSLRQQLLRMGSLAEAILEKSLQSLWRRDTALAREVKIDDLEIDRVDIAVDDLVLRILATQAPVADDLRNVIACKMIATDLERVGDLARNIAGCADALGVVGRNLDPEVEVVAALQDGGAHALAQPGVFAQRVVQAGAEANGFVSIQAGLNAGERVVTEGNDAVGLQGVVLRGLACRCPRCGRGRLFDGFLTVRLHCDACGLDNSFIDAGDGPAVFVILLAGAVVVALALIVEILYQPPFWLHAVLWLPLILLATLLPLRAVKGLLIALDSKWDAVSCAPLVDAGLLPEKLSVSVPAL